MGVLLVIILAVICGALVWLMVRVRQQFFAFRAGSLSRRWIAAQTVKVLADPTALPSVKAFAQELLVFAFHPLSMEELKERSAGREQDVSVPILSGREVEFGVHFAGMQIATRHVAILVGLHDPIMSKSLLKIVEGTMGFEALLGRMAVPSSGTNAAAKASTKPQLQQAFANDLATSFDVLDHGHIARRVTRVVGSRHELACA